ncbi:hypothetical protein [Streptomyces globosus]|uniref:hypothetical protein n=1 Tax=Streptomyces globosus TaxID=68209 RepID=UPI003805A671
MSRSDAPRRKSRRLALSAAAVTAVAVTAAGAGYLAGRGEPTAPDRPGVEMAGKPGALPHPEITRSSGVSRVKSDSPGHPVKIRPCPGPAPYGSHGCHESSLRFLPDDTPVRMWCWTDGTAPDTRAPSDKRWFYVIEADGSPHPGEAGYVHSALIPTAEQVRVPECTTQRLLEAAPLPPAPPDPAPDPSPTPSLPTPSRPAHPTPAPPAASAPSPTPPAGSTPAPSPAGRTITQQSGRHGSPTFTDPHAVSGPGERIPAHSRVEVQCRVYAPEMKTANPDGWWYRIAGSPWNGRYYAVANTFMNGDAPGQTPPTNTDWTVPVC